MKKLVAYCLAVILAVSMMIGCTGSGTKKDGTYKAIYSTADDHGWTDYVEVTIKDDKITAVMYDAINDTGDVKSKDVDYENAMKDAGYETWPADYQAKLVAKLIEKQKIDDVDAVASATTSSGDFKKLVKALSKNMSNGSTGELKVDR